MADMRERQCTSCYRYMPKAQFGRTQWKLPERVCLECAEAFRMNEYNEWLETRREETRLCFVCDQFKDVEGFGRRQWRQTNPKCLPCAAQGRVIEYAIGEEDIDTRYHTLLN